MTEFCAICGHPRGEQEPMHGETCGCGCHHDSVELPPGEFQHIKGFKQGVELQGDNWPLTTLERAPNGVMGVKVTWPGAQIGIEELAFIIEPERAQRLRDALTAHLKMVGLE